MLTPDDLHRAAAALLLGASCPGCGQPGPGLCPGCSAALAALTPFRVPGSPTPVWAAAAYEGLPARLVVAYKERRARPLARPLGELLAVAVASGVAQAGLGSAGPLVLVPVPSRPAAVRERGDDVTARLARRAASVLAAAGLPTRVESCLRHVARVGDQAGLGESERLANMRGSVAARPRGAGVRVVVDDITTTGASLAAAAQALRAAGSPPLCSAVVAATPRYHPRERP